MHLFVKLVYTNASFKTLDKSIEKLICNFDTTLITDVLQVSHSCNFQVALLLVLLMLTLGETQQSDNFVDAQPSAVETRFIFYRTTD